MPHLCFYSEGCKFSRSFIAELKNTPYVSEFKFFCVDRDGAGKRLPIVEKGISEKWLSAVPTLIIEGEEGPRTDAEVFNWLSQKKLQDGARKGPQGAEAGLGEPAAYGNELASNKWSDSYSFFETQFDVGKGVGFDPIPRAFAQLQEDGGFGSAMPIGHGGAIGAAAGAPKPLPSQKSKKEQAMDAALENFQRMRDMDIPKGIARS